MTEKKSKPRKPDDLQESQRFVETARKLEVDESGKAFESALKKIVQKPRKS